MTHDDSLKAVGPVRGEDSPHRILVVDDDAAIRELSMQILSLSGYGVDTAADGAAAWQVLNSNEYDLLITDSNMPKLSGVELIKKLHAARMDMPVIMVTGLVPEDELSRHPWLRIDATLLKPFTTDALVGTVNVVLNTTDVARRRSESLPRTRRQPSADGVWL